MQFSFVSDGYQRACEGIEQARETIVVTVREEYAERLASADATQRAALEIEIFAVIEAKLKPPSQWAFF